MKGRKKRRVEERLREEMLGHAPKAQLKVDISVRGTRAGL
jgi:hypothetical protein